MNKTNFNYRKASDLDLAKHLVEEIKFCMNDKYIREHTDFSNWTMHKEGCGTFRCVAGHIAVRNGVEVCLAGEDEGGYMTNFEEIFIGVNRSIFFNLFYSYGESWSEVFGLDTNKDYEYRLKAAQSLLKKVTHTKPSEV